VYLRKLRCWTYPEFTLGIRRVAAGTILDSNSMNKVYSSAIRSVTRGDLKWFDVRVILEDDSGRIIPLDSIFFEKRGSGVIHTNDMQSLEYAPISGAVDTIVASHIASTLVVRDIIPSRIVFLEGISSFIRHTILSRIFASNH
jgi:hypothetical protein